MAPGKPSFFRLSARSDFASSHVEEMYERLVNHTRSAPINQFRLDLRSSKRKIASILGSELTTRIMGYQQRLYSLVKGAFPFESELYFNFAVLRWSAQGFLYTHDFWHCDDSWVSVATCLRGKGTEYTLNYYRKAEFLESFESPAYSLKPANSHRVIPRETLVFNGYDRAHYYSQRGVFVPPLVHKAPKGRGRLLLYFNMKRR